LRGFRVRRVDHRITEVDVVPVAFMCEVLRITNNRGGWTVLHYAKLETEQQQQQQAREEEEDQRDTTEDAFCGLQCGDSLAIAANHIGEDVFGVKKLLRRTRRVLVRSR
jgi:hypothetical protein